MRQAGREAIMVIQGVTSVAVSKQKAYALHEVRDREHKQPEVLRGVRNCAAA